MTELKWRGVTPEEFIQELKDLRRKLKENKYAFQVRLVDITIVIDEDKRKALGITLPFQNIDQAERALQERVIQPTAFLEADGTEHQVVVFDPEPIGFSGFMGCVTHSLALTDLGLFEVGRYPAMSPGSQSHSWEWFLHRQLATHEQVAAWREEHKLSPHQLVARASEALREGSRST